MGFAQSGFAIKPSFSVESVLNRTFSALFQKPVLFFGLAALASIPLSFTEDTSSSSVAWGAIAVFLELFLETMVQGVIAYAVFLALRGQEETFGNILNQGLGQMGPLLLVSLISGLGILLGLVLLVIPGIILLCVLAVAAQACVVERLGVVDSLTRSAKLTEGYRWPIFGLCAIAAIGLLAISFALDIVLGLMFSAGTGSITRLTNVFVDVITIAFNSVMCGVIYFDLRAAKEGLTLDALADIFD